MLGVSRNGHHAFKSRKPSDRQLKKEQRMEEIREIHKESHEIHGAPKIAEEMRKKGDAISDKTVGNYMGEIGIRACYTKRSVKTTVQPDFSKKLGDLLKERSDPEEPNAVWRSDITCIWTHAGFVYLTSMMDLHSREIMSWALSDTLEAKWVVEAIGKAKKARNADKPKIMHSGRGIQHACEAYVEATKGWKRSHSKKACPWDNACMESFHSVLKREWLNRFRIIDHDHAHRLVFEYIDTFYNTVRMHSHCEYQSPQEYEKEYLDKMESAIKKAG